MKTLLTTLLIFLAFFRRLLFWLAIIQQKEYRWDRIQLYLASQEGRREFMALLPNRSWWQIKLWKRPRWTPRLVVLAFVTLLVVMAIFSVGYVVGQTWWPDVWGIRLAILVGQVILCYILIPVLMMIGLIPTAIISLMTTNRVSHLAKSMVVASRPLVIGITGSYGKTSTKQLLAHVLSGKYSVFATPASYNTLYSVAKSIAENYRGEEILISEYGAYKTGEIARLCRVVAPRLAVVTGITSQHLGIFGSVEAIVRAKSELTQSLPADGVVFYNAADSRALEVARAFDGIKYGYADPDNSQVQSAGVTAGGKLEFVLDSLVVTTQLIGLHYLTCVEAVLAISEHLGVPRSQVIARLMSFVPTANFTRLDNWNQNIRLLDNGRTSNPVGYQAMLTLADSLSAQTKILIFGGIVDLGQESGSIHRQLVRASNLVFDQIWYVGQTGRDEFDQVMTDKIVSDRDLILSRWRSLKPETLVVIEGRLPVWLSQVIDQGKDKRVV